MAINKKLIHFNTFENFNSKKLSANIENTQYTLGVDGEIQSGSPDILYQSIIYIKDTKQQWTHGLLYNENNLIIPITYNELVILRNNNQLIPGIQYRITDYVTTCNNNGCADYTDIVTSSAGHPFDIIIQADSENTLNENAKAIIHEGDTYFQNCNLESWELKYSLDNNIYIHKWADSENGKGVIYYIKDEYDNETYYDFHNILYTFTSLLFSNIELNVPYYTFPGENGNDITISNNFFYRAYYNNIIKSAEDRNGTATSMFLPAVILKNSKNNYIDLSQTVYIDGTDNYLRDCTNVYIIGDFNKIFSKTGYFSLSGEYNTIKSLVWNSELIPTQHFLQILINKTSSYFSLYVDISNYGGLEYFKQVANGRISKIERISDGVYVELIDGVWQGDLSTIERNVVYKVTNGSGSSFEIYLKGDLINESEYSYYINPGDGTSNGVTYFGMPGNQSVPLDDLKALLVSHGGGQIKDLKNSYYISYNSTYDIWLGDNDKLTSLNPNNIYLIITRASNTEGFTITLPTVDKSLLKTYNTTIDCYLYNENIEITSGSINSPQYIIKDSGGKIIVYNDGDVINQISNIESNAKTYTDEAINSFDTKVITLKIHLVKGYRWVSFYVNTTLQEFQTALGTNGVSISTISTGGTSEADLINTYDSTTNTWSGNITELDFSKMYMIKTSSECDIYLTGEQINPADLSISLQTGWNWIGFPLTEEVSLSDAFANCELKQGDIITDRYEGSVQYYKDLILPNGNTFTGWSSEFKMKPGHGYTFNSVDNKNFTYPDTYYKPFGNVGVSSELGESTIKAASLDLVTKVSEESKQYVDDKIDNLNKVTQTIDLVSGSNWVSFYVNTTLQELYSVLGTNGISISTISVGGMSEADLINTYDSGTNSWSGNITELDFSKMYIINVTEAATIEVSGELLNVEDYTISLEPGWNWIGYPVHKEGINFEDALSNIEPVPGNIIKSQLLTAQYIDLFGTTGWLVENGESLIMNPGEGYQYYNASSETKTFTYPTELDVALSTKQDKLVSGTNIKTVNGTSILGSGDITIESGSEQIQSDWSETDTTSKAYIANKPNITGGINSALTIQCDNGVNILTGGGVLYSQIINASYIVVQDLTLGTNGKGLLIEDKNGDTILVLTNTGNGTKFLSDNGTYKSISIAYPQVNHGTSDTTFVLTPNVLHIWDEVTELSLTLADPTDTTVANEYVFQFTSGATATTLTLPDTIKWLETPSIESDKVYQVSILNNCGTILGFV